MLGFLIFQQVYLNLGEDCRNKVLGNIFDIDNVSVSCVFLRDDTVIFRLFSGGVFYQFFFIFEIGENQVFNSDKIVNCVTFLSNSNDKEINRFIYQLVRCQNECQVYYLVKKFL